MEAIKPHSETIIAVLFTLLPFLLPPVNRQILKLTGNNKVKAGLDFAKALEDGLQADEALTVAKSTLKALGK